MITHRELLEGITIGLFIVSFMITVPIFIIMCKEWLEDRKYKKTKWDAFNKKWGKK